MRKILRKIYLYFLDYIDVHHVVDEFPETLFKGKNIMPGSAEKIKTGYFKYKDVYVKYYKPIVKELTEEESIQLVKKTLSQ